MPKETDRLLQVVERVPGRRLSGDIFILIERSAVDQGEVVERQEALRQGAQPGTIFRRQFLYGPDGGGLRVVVEPVKTREFASHPVMIPPNVVIYICPPPVHHFVVRVSVADKV